LSIDIFKTNKINNMAFIRFYNPVVPFYRDENENEAYDMLVHRFNSISNGSQVFPAANIAETDKEYSIEMALPGVAKKDIHVQHEKELLTISIDGSSEKKEKEDFTRREFNYSGASRSFKTGEKVDRENITARYENGILTVHLPKKEVMADKPVQSISIE